MGVFGSGSGGGSVAQRRSTTAAGFGALALLVLTCWLDTNTTGPRHRHDMNDAEFNGNLYYLTRVMAFQFAEVALVAAAAALFVVADWRARGRAFPEFML